MKIIYYLIVVLAVTALYSILTVPHDIVINLIGALCFGIISWTFVNIVTKNAFRKFVFAFVGILSGGVIAYFLNQIFITPFLFASLKPVIPILVYLFFSVSFALIFWIKSDDIGGMMFSGSGKPVENIPGSSYKILDTSVIIDGRIADIAETGFMDGVLLVPRFVLNEIQLVADSSDPIKRSRGRRGLDILNTMKGSKNTRIKITDEDFFEVKEVDQKLLLLSKTTGAPIVTNDFNLNKVAGIQGITVLNINELANSLKPTVLPGEILNVQIVKEGKDQGQGIAFLEDGTMVVVDNGKYYIGEKIGVTVTSVLQTPAGRMIFTTIN